MKRSTDRILTTHVGSLTRPTDIIDAMRARVNHEPYDAGRFSENLLAGTDCGFSQGPFSAKVHPSIQWAKLEALAAGAKLASQELWGGG